MAAKKLLSGNCRKLISTVKSAKIKPPFFSVLMSCVLLWVIGASLMQHR